MMETLLASSMTVLLLWTLQSMRIFFRMGVIVALIGGGYLLHVSVENSTLSDRPRANSSVLTPLQESLRQFIGCHPDNRAAWALLQKSYQGEGRPDIAWIIESYLRFHRGGL